MGATGDSIDNAEHAGWHARGRDDEIFIAEGISAEMAEEVFQLITESSSADPVIGEQLTWVQVRTLETLPAVKIRVQDHYTKKGDPFRGVTLSWSEDDDTRKQLVFCLEADDAGNIRVTYPDGVTFRRLEAEAAEANIDEHREWVERRRQALSQCGSSVEEELEWFRYTALEDGSRDLIADDIRSFMNKLKGLSIAMVHSTEQPSHAKV